MIRGFAAMLTTCAGMAAVMEKSTDRQRDSHSCEFRLAGRAGDEDPRMVSFHEALELLLKNSPRGGGRALPSGRCGGAGLRENVDGGPGVSRTSIGDDGWSTPAACGLAARAPDVQGDSDRHRQETVRRPLSTEPATCVEVMTGRAVSARRGLHRAGGRGYGNERRPLRLPNPRHPVGRTLHSHRRQRCRGEGRFCDGIRPSGSARGKSASRRRAARLAHVLDASRRSPWSRRGTNSCRWMNFPAAHPNPPIQRPLRLPPP
jgi:hypothetical protein